MSVRRIVQRPPSSMSPSGMEKLSWESRVMSWPRSSRAASTRSSSRRIRTESSSIPQIDTLLMPWTASMRGRTTSSSRKSVRSESPLWSTPNIAIGSESWSSDHMPTRSTEFGSWGRARSMRSRTSALAVSMSRVGSNVIHIRTRPSCE